MLIMKNTVGESPIAKAEIVAGMPPRYCLGGFYLVSEQNVDPKITTLHRSSNIRVRGRIGDRGMTVSRYISRRWCWEKF